VPKRRMLHCHEQHDRCGEGYRVQEELLLDFGRDVAGGQDASDLHEREHDEGVHDAHGASEYPLQEQRLVVASRDAADYYSEC